MSEGYPFWVWLIAGLALCAAETIIPGAFLIWIGAAGLVLGFVDYLYPLSFEAQALIFAALAAVLALAGKRFYGSVAAQGPPPALSRAEALVGHEYFLDSAIERGFGRMRVGDSVWRVSGPDLPAGAKVRVVSAGGGADLHVEKA
jgi:membrane protein implicated in regulation of membrane protease activity